MGGEAGHHTDCEVKPVLPPVGPEQPSNRCIDATALLAERFVIVCVVRHLLCCGGFSGVISGGRPTVTIRDTASNRTSGRRRAIQGPTRDRRIESNTHGYVAGRSVVCRANAVATACEHAKRVVATEWSRAPSSGVGHCQ